MSTLRTVLMGLGAAVVYGLVNEATRGDAAVTTVTVVIAWWFGWLTRAVASAK